MRLLGVLAFLLMLLTMGQAMAEPVWIKAQPGDCSILQSFNIWQNKIVEARWKGDCVNGKAVGEGVLTLSLEQFFEDDGDFGIPAATRYFSLIQHGRFVAGKAEGVVLGEFTSGQSVVAEFHEGLVGQTVLAGVMFDGQGAWFRTKMDYLSMDGHYGASESVDGGDPFDEAHSGGKDHVQGKKPGLPDLTAYDDADDALAKVLELYPLNSEAHRLKAEIAGFWGYDAIRTYRGEPIRSFCRHGFNVAVFPEMAWTCLYSVSKATGVDQSDQWLLMAVFRGDYKLVHAEVHHFFHDRDFSARNRPLKVANFASNKEFMAAAHAILGDDPSRDRVREVMLGAGLRETGNRDSPTLHFEKPGNLYYMYMSMCPAIRFGGYWHFDTNDHLEMVDPFSWSGCP